MFLSSLSDLQSDVRSEVVLPSSLVIRVQKQIADANPQLTVSQYVEKAVRAALAMEENKEESVHTEDDSEVIKSRLKALGYL